MRPRGFMRGRLVVKKPLKKVVTSALRASFFIIPELAAKWLNYI
jgi:hypothetical protein